MLIPAHNEQADIADTISSLRNLRRVPDRILVISDNSTDNTVAIAKAMDIEVIETTGNAYKKAGALNAGFRHLIQDGTLPEFIITMDADTVFDEDFVSSGLCVLATDSKLGVLSAVCSGKRGLVSLPSQPPSQARHLDNRYRRSRWSLRYLLALIVALFNMGVVWSQQVEYARAGLLRLRSDIHTMSGAGSIIRAEAIVDLLEDHRRRGKSSVYLYEEREDNLVEDFTLTLDLKKLGWKCTNNFRALADTDLMRTLPALIRQRTRWVRGTIDELRRRKFSREARLSSWTIIFGLLILPLFYLWPVLIIMNLVHGTASITSLWFLLFIGLWQALMTQKMGWKSMLISFLLVPDMLYSVVRHYWVISSVISSFRSKQQRWE